MHKSSYYIILSILMMTLLCGCDLINPTMRPSSTNTTDYSYVYATPTPMPVPESQLVEQLGPLSSLNEAIDFIKILNTDNTTASIVINANIPLFTNSDFGITDPIFTTDLSGRPLSATSIITIENLEEDVILPDLSYYEPLGWSDSRYVRKVALISEDLCGYNSTSGIITGTKLLLRSLTTMEERIQTIVTDNPDISILYRVTAVYCDDNNIVPNGLLVEAYSIEDNGETFMCCTYLLNVQSRRTIDYTTGAVS